MNLKTDEKKVKHLYFSLCLGCVLILAVAVALAMCGFVEIACFLAIMMLFLGICGLVLVAGVKIHRRLVSDWRDCDDEQLVFWLGRMGDEQLNLLEYLDTESIRELLSVAQNIHDPRCGLYNLERYLYLRSR